MTHDEAEFLMSQQLDGTLDAADVARLRAAIDADALLAVMWREHQTLDAALRSSRVSLDTFAADADPMSTRIAALLDEEREPVLELKPAARARSSFKLSEYRWGTPLAAAAMLAIGLSIGLVANGIGGRASDSHSNAGPHAVEQPSIAVASADSIPTITLNGSVEDSASSSKGVATFTVGTPANLSASYVASLYVADRDAQADRIVIQGVGRPPVDVFD